jgi:hypothetical protein
MVVDKVALSPLRLCEKNINIGYLSKMTWFRMS